MEKSYKLKIDKTLADVYGIDTEEYRNFLVSSVHFFSKRTLNCLNKKGIETVKMLLELSQKEFFEVDVFGNKCFTEIKEFCEEIISQNDADKGNSLYNYEKYLNSLDIYKVTKKSKKDIDYFFTSCFRHGKKRFFFYRKI